MAVRRSQNRFFNHEQYNSFWIRNPALLFGLSFLIGTGAYFFKIFFFFWLGYLAKTKQWPAFGLTLIATCYPLFFQHQEISPRQGYFSIHNLKIHKSHFGKSYQYKGTLYADQQSVPCTIYYPFEQMRPSASQDYLVFGNVKKNHPQGLIFHAKKWIPASHPYRFAETRFQLKQKFRSFLLKRIKDPDTAELITALFTGDLNNKMIRYHFSKLGLQHLLAISGFHFASLIAFCSIFLSFFCPEKLKLILLILLIHAYFFFVGNAPSVQRSYLTALFYLVGKLIDRNASGLNLLGAALLIELIIDPFAASQIGFQLSFASCFGILLFFPFLEKKFTSFLFEKTEGFVGIFEKKAKLILKFFIAAFSLNVSVTLAISPLLFYHFQTFPLLSIAYNLLIPPLITFILALLLISLSLSFLSIKIAAPFFFCLKFLAQQVLDLISFPPHLLNISLKAGLTSIGWIPFYLFLLFLLARKVSFDEYPHFRYHRSPE